MSEYSDERNSISDPSDVSGKTYNADQSQYSDEERSISDPLDASGKAYNVDQAKELIKQALFDMEFQGYDFKFKTNAFEGNEYKQCSKVRHRSYLRHQCWRCIATTNSKQEKKKRFTTTKGTAEVRFKFMRLRDFHNQNPSFKKKKADSKQEEKKMKYPYILLWDFYIYHMKCKECTRRGNYSKEELEENPQLVYAVPFIYHGVLGEITEKFVKRIRRKFNPEQRSLSEQTVKIRKPRPRLKIHKKALCQACAKKICDNYKADEGDRNDYDSNAFLRSSSSSEQSSSRSSQRSRSSHQSQNSNRSRSDRSQKSDSKKPSQKSNQKEKKEFNLCLEGEKIYLDKEKSNSKKAVDSMSQKVQQDSKSQKSSMSKQSSSKKSIKSQQNPRPTKPNPKPKKNQNTRSATYTQKKPTNNAQPKNASKPKQQTQKS